MKNIKRFAQLAKHFAKTGSAFKSAGIFRRTVSAAQQTFNKSTIKNDLLVKGARKLFSRGGKNTIGVGGEPLKKNLGASARAVGRNKIDRGTGRRPSAFRRGALSIGKTLAVPSLITVGAVGMMGLSIMNGANNAAKDIIFERYMADQRFSRDMLLQSRLGTAMGTNRMNKYGSTVGLSNSLSRTRHGASY